MLGSPLENRFHAVLGFSAAGIKRSDANELVKQLVNMYKDNITKDGGPIGYTFDEMYDLKTITPRKQFVEVYDSVEGDLEEMGISFRY